MEKKKTKLTISGSSKKPVKNFDSSRSQGKKTVIIGNQTKKISAKEASISSQDQNRLIIKRMLKSK